MTPRALLAQARELVERPVPGTEGLWARAAAHLARQALESAMRVRLARRTHRIEEVSFRVQLLCLTLECDAAAAAQAAYAWSALSTALHHHGYELPPTARSLRAWVDAVERVVERLDRE
ncbi:MAG: hypothetical protein KF729_15545 [Sandaracinaceae bacterium]|nr:hypothetical protein [Sandaracinaceae bacterium]